MKPGKMRMVAFINSVKGPHGMITTATTRPVGDRAGQGGLDITFDGEMIFTLVAPGKKPVEVPLTNVSYWEREDEKKDEKAK